MDDEIVRPASGPGDDDLRALVAANPGQATFDEYRHLRNTIRSRAPCRLLVFGVGKDSVFWVAANAGGRTAFVEHQPRWIARTREVIPGVEVHPVTYGTKRTQWRRLMERPDRLFMVDLPNDVLAENWDVIFVDAPQGGSRRRPGRMKSIYTAAMLARRCTDIDVLVHDCDRPVERGYSDRYLGPERMRIRVRTLRHYHFRPTLPVPSP